MRYTFKKDERLCSRNLIEKLFKSGKTVTRYPLKLYYLKTNESQPFPAQVLIAVSKKNIRKASKRNLAKRRMREAYRHLKPAFFDELGTKSINLQLAIVYVSPEINTYQDIYYKLNKALIKVLNNIND